MCLIGLALKQHRDYPLIICANRDELHDRPTKAAYMWDNEGIFAGQDLEKGGTWLGVTPTGKIAAVTNVRSLERRKEDDYSRGDIVTSFLKKDIQVVDYIKEMESKANRYQGYNALIGNRDKLFYFSNRSDEIAILESGIHTLSNASLNTPWPKTNYVEEKMKEIISEQKNEDMLIEQLINLLSKDRTFPDEQLPNTGVGLQLERALSSVFINGDTYGTRVSTIVLINQKNEMTFVEKSYGKKGKKEGLVVQKFTA